MTYSTYRDLPTYPVTYFMYILFMFLLNIYIIAYYVLVKFREMFPR